MARNSWSEYCTKKVASGSWKIFQLYIHYYLQDKILSQFVSGAGFLYLICVLFTAAGSVNTMMGIARLKKQFLYASNGWLPTSLITSRATWRKEKNKLTFFKIHTFFADFLCRKGEKEGKVGGGEGEKERCRQTDTMAKSIALTGADRHFWGHEIDS